MFFVGIYKAFRWLIISLICALTFFALETSGFQPQPIQAIVIVDKNVERTEFVGNVSQNFPDGSIPSRQISFRGTVSSALMDNGTFEELSANQFKTRAEIVLVFVNTSTILDGEPEFPWKKKTFVVVFGSSVPETWKNVATDDNHLFLVTRDSNSSMIMERLIKQIESDSKYYCDIDMYKSKKGQICRNCSNVCGADSKQGLLACSQYCPYVWSKSKEKELARSSSSAPIPVTTNAVKDDKYTVVVIILVVLGGIIVVILAIFGTNYFVKKIKQLTPCNSDRDMREMQLSRPHQETGGQGYEGSSLINSGQEVDSNMPDEGECRVSLNEAGLSSDGDDGAGPCMTNPENMPVLISLKNKQEADLNAHYSDVNVRNVH